MICFLRYPTNKGLEIWIYPDREEVHKGLSDHIPQRGDHHVPLVDESGIILNAAEIAERERTKQQHYERHLLRDLQTRQTAAQTLQARSNVVIAILTAALVLVSVIGGLVSFLQFQAAKKNAEASEAQSRSTVKLVDAARTQAEQAVAQTRVMELQQRAWVALSSPPNLQPTKNGVVWSLHNFGSSPALHIAAKGVNVGKPTEISTTQDAICREIGSANQPWEILFPGQAGRPRAAFVVGAPIAYVVGCIRYRDKFGADRWTKFCYEPDARDPSAFISCLGYNSTDADEESKNRRPPN